MKGWGPERHVYFTAVFSRPFENFGIMQDTIPVVYNTKRFRSHLEAWGADLRFWMQFPTCEGETVTIKVAVNNIRELEGKNFATLKVEGEKLWEDQLSKFVIEGSQEQKETFYTSVYHTFLHPFIFQDADVLLIIPYFLCGILIVRYILCLIWYSGILMRTLLIRCWYTMIRVWNICCLFGHFTGMRLGV